MNREKIKNILPHREPMLLVDEAELDGDAAIGKYTVRGDEYFLRGHYPGNPIVPGVILCEMMAQSSCLLILDDSGSGENQESGGYTPYFTGINNVKFKNKVLPGDTIVFKTQLKAKKGAFCFIKGEGTVDGKLCVTGELSFAVVKG